MENTTCELPIRDMEASVSAAADAFTELLSGLQERGLVITVFGVPIRIQIPSIN